MRRIDRVATTITLVLAYLPCLSFALFCGLWAYGTAYHIGALVTHARNFTVVYGLFAVFVLWRMYREARAPKTQTRTSATPRLALVKDRPDSR